MAATNTTTTTIAAMGLLEEFSLKYQSAGVVLQDKWSSLIDIVGDDPQTFWVWGTSLLIVLVYVGYAAAFTVMDITNWPRFVRKYKIQPGQNEPVEKEKLIHAIKVVLVNLLIVGPIATFVLYRLAFERHNSQLRELPTLVTILLDLVIFAVLEEIMFYYAHRLLHHKALYKHVHKKHHEWTSPIAAMTFYSHPVEHVVANLMPVGIAVVLRGAHIVSAWIFFTIAIINAMSDHAGYEFPFSAGSVRFHDFHHAKFNYNFGVLGFLDKLHGTFKETAPVKLDAKPIKRVSPTKMKKTK